jgi:asparagine synthase (glutamine-hydrolysing)
MIYRYCRHYLASQNLANADRASMAVGLELRARVLDHRFVELTGRIPSRLKLRGLLGTQAAAHEGARGAAAAGDPAAGQARVHRPLAEPLRDGLAASRLRAGGLLDADAVTRLIDEHVRGRRDHARFLWSALVLELWRTAHGVTRC